jgi:predicted Zn-dependent protease
MTVRQLFAGLGAVLWLSACATDNMTVYESAMENSIVSRQPESQSLPIATGSGDEIDSYRMADLDPGHRPALDSDEAGLWMTMDKAEAAIQSSGHVITDKRLNTYVKRIVCRVAGPHCKDIRVYLMRVPHFNATMAPNGSMQIWSGLLLRARNEAQLAAIIGHEVAHYLRRHSLQQMRNAIDTAGALTFFNMATLGVTAGLSDLVAAGSLTAYRRDFEREADGYGLVLMAQAGYDPREVSRTWRQLIRERHAENDGESSAYFLASHPAESERVAAMDQLAEKARKRWRNARRVGRKDYQAMMQTYRAGFLEDELRLHRFERTQALLNMLKQDGHNPAELHFFQGELYRLRNGEGDRRRALESYRAALAAGRPPVALHRAMGLILLKEDQQAMARKAFRQYLRQNPKAEDAEMIRHLMKQG